MPRAIIAHSSPKAPPRETVHEGARLRARAFGSSDITESRTESEPSRNESIVSASLKLSIEQARPKFVGQTKRQSLPKEQHTPNLLLSLPSSSDVAGAETYQLSFASVKATTVVPTALPVESSSSIPKPASSRIASKIPTPLPRKTLKSSPTSSSDSASTSCALNAGALRASSFSCAKTHHVVATSNKSSASQTTASCSIPRTSEAPFPVRATVVVESTPAPPSPSSRLPSASARCHEEATLAAERRRTVVEVCEKVVVSRGKTPTTPPVTPFITVNRVGDKQTHVTEVRSDQRASGASKES